LRKLKREKAREPAETITESTEPLEEVESYDVDPPFAKVIIGKNANTGKLSYLIKEVKLTREEADLFIRAVKIFETEAPVKINVDVEKYFAEQLNRVVKKYRYKVSADTWAKWKYYIRRDVTQTSFGILHGLMRDLNLEDIKCVGVNHPLFVYHRKYGSLETNIKFTSDVELDNYVLKLAHMAGKHLSTAFPKVDGELPGGHRLAAFFREEISRSGSGFTIRKFREDPLSIIDLIRMGTVSPRIAAYLWMGVEHLFSMLIIGPTGAGKTTTLNAILCLIKPGADIITIEETPELNLSQNNWIPFITRQSFGLTEKMGEINLFELVETSLRHRPLYLVVGEVRGKEAFALFQALYTGHGGACTIHATNISEAVMRLTSEPLNIPLPLISALQLAIVIGQVRKAGVIAETRRILSIDEVVGYEKYVNIAEWDPKTDSFNVKLENSVRLKEVAKSRGVSFNELIAEIGRREKYLADLANRGVRSYREVADAIIRYYEVERHGK
jgi:flagellar protein FlaI